VLRGQLQGIDHAQHLVEIPSGGHWIDQDQLDLLVRPNDEDVAHCLIVGCGALRGVARGGCRQHVPGLGNLEIGVTDHRIVRRKTSGVLDVGSPFGVVSDRIDREAYDLDIALVEFRFEARHGAELGGADRREVLRMGEQDGPRIPDPVMKANVAFSRVCCKIPGGIANLKSHHRLLPHNEFVHRL